MRLSTLVPWPGMCGDMKRGTSLFVVIWVCLIGRRNHQLIAQPLPTDVFSTCSPVQVVVKSATFEGLFFHEGSVRRSG